MIIAGCIIDTLWTWRKIHKKAFSIPADVLLLCWQSNDVDAPALCRMMIPGKPD